MSRSSSGLPKIDPTLQFTPQAFGSQSAKTSDGELKFWFEGLISSLITASLFALVFIFKLILRLLK